MNRNMRKLLVLGLVVAVAFVGCSVAFVGADYVDFKIAEQEHFKNLELEHASIATFIVAILVGVVVANALIPTIANQTAQLEANDDLETAEQDLVGIWDLVIIVGVMLMIIKMAL